MFVEIPKTIGINWFYRFVNSRRLMLLYGCLWHMFVETLEKATGMDLVHQVVNWYTLIGNGCPVGRHLSCWLCFQWQIRVVHCQDEIRDQWLGCRTTGAPYSTRIHINVYV